MADVPMWLAALLLGAGGVAGLVFGVSLMAWLGISGRLVRTGPGVCPICGRR